MDYHKLAIQQSNFYCYRNQFNILQNSNKRIYYQKEGQFSPIPAVYKKGKFNLEVH